MDRLVQIAVAVGMGAGILLVGRWAIRLLVTGGPPEVDPDDVVEVELGYQCVVCGMQLTVTYAQDDDVNPPRHCHEQMEPV